MQEALKDLEIRLDKLFGKGAPYQMSDKAKHSFSGAAWAIALILGIMQAWGALSLWQLGHTAVFSPTYMATTYYGSGQVMPNLGLFFYLSFLVVLIDAILLLMAVSPLREFHKRGWDFLYYALLVNVIYAVLRIFSNVGGGFGEFIVGLFFSALAAYFLFQVRNIFVEGKVKVEVPPAKHPGRVHTERDHSPEDTD
jgi:hypothetical protein